MHSRNVRRPTAVRFHRRRPAHLRRIHNIIIYDIGTCILYAMCCNSSHADRRRRRRRPTLARSINGNPCGLLSSVSPLRQLSTNKIFPNG